MKTSNFFLCAGLSLLLCGISHAQIQIMPDGGVKMGDLPSTTESSPAWQVTDRGVEINIGDILFHASNGKTMRFGAYRSMSKSGVIIPGGGGSSTGGGTLTNPISFFALTGNEVQIGLAQSRVWAVNTYNFSSLNGTSSVSDRRMKRNIMPIGEARQQVMALRPVTYDFIVPDDYPGDTMELQNRAGFIAQEVLEVLPGAVGYNEETDLYSLKYSYFIPYLTKTIQEQEEVISNLEEEVSNLKEQLQASETRMERIEAMLEGLGAGNPENEDMPGIMSAGGNQGNETVENGMPEHNSQTETAPLQQNGESGENNEDAIGARLWQNVPNPTNGNTVIRYELPANCKGRIVLTSGSGQTVKIFDLPKRAGIDEIEVNGQSLNAGVYSYSLVVNGRMVDTKRMVLNR